MKSRFPCPNCNKLVTLLITEKIPGAWLVQIKVGGMD